MQTLLSRFVSHPLGPTRTLILMNLGSDSNHIQVDACPLLVAAPADGLTFRFVENWVYNVHMSTRIFSLFLYFFLTQIPKDVNQQTDS